MGTLDVTSSRSGSRALVALLGWAYVACRPFASSHTTPPTPPAPLTATAQPSTVAPLGAASVVASGGYPPYTFTFDPTPPSSGPAATLSAAGGYRAGTVGSVADTIDVTDQDGGSVSVVIAVGQALALVPASAAVNPGASFAFTASGGQPPYRFVLASGCITDAGGSSLDAGGDVAVYTAGTACADEEDSLFAYDANDAGAGPSSVSIGPGVTAFPGVALVEPGDSVSFSASGGVPPYRFAFAPKGNRSGGTITTAGSYQAGVNPAEQDLIQVADGHGLVGAARVSVGNTQIAFASPEAFTLYPARLYGETSGEDLVAVAEPSESTAPAANVVQIFQGTTSGLVSTIVQDFTTPVCALLSPEPTSDGVTTEELFFATTIPDVTLGIATCVNLEGYGVAFGGGFVPGPSLSSESNDGGAILGIAISSGYVQFTATTGDTLFAVLGYGGDLPDGGPGPNRITYSLYPQAEDGSEIGTTLVPAGGLATPSLDYLDTGGSAAGQGSAIAFSMIQAPAEDGGDDRLAVLHLDDGVVVADGGLVMLASETLELGTCSFQETGCSPSPPAVGLADLDGDGVEDVFVYRISLTAPGTLDAYLTNDAGPALHLPEVSLPPAAAIQSFQGFNDAGAYDGLDVVGPYAGLRLEWSGSAWLTVDAGFAAGTSSRAYGDFNRDQLVDVAVASSGGTLTVELGDLLGRLGSGDAFQYPTFPGVSSPAAVGDIDGDGIAEVAVGGRGITLFSGAGPDLLSTELIPDDAGLLSEATFAVLNTAAGAFALGQPQSGLPELLGVTASDAGWVLTRTPLSVPFVPTTLSAISAGGPVPGGDVLVSGSFGDGGLGFQAFAVNGAELTASLASQLPFLPGFAPFVVPLAVTGAAEDDLLFEVLEEPSAGDGGSADVFLEVLGVGTSGQWSDGGPSFLVGATSLPPSCATLLQSLGPITPFAPRWGERPSEVLLIPPSGDCLDGSCDQVCLIDPATQTGAVVVDYSALDAALGGAAFLFTADVNGDHLTDIVLTDEATVVYAATALGDGGFAAPELMLGTDNLLFFSLQGLGDFDGDGRSDLLLQSSVSDVLLYTSSPSYVTVLRSAGDGGVD